jgi:AcrR family transcriptional regulator
VAKEATGPDDLGGSLPPAPWQRPGPAPRRAPARVLSKEAVVDAGMRVLDAEGFDALSMRRVAAELGTGPASLYAHVANKGELLDLMIDRVVGEYEFPEPDPERWQEQLKEMARFQRRVFQSHPGIARAVLGRIPLGPNGLDAIEGFLAIVRAGDLPEHAAAWAGDIFAAFITANVFEEELHHSGEGMVKSEDQLEEWLDQLRRYIKALPKERYPNLTEYADPMFESGGPDGRFEFGLDLLVRGLASYKEDRGGAG